VFDLPPKEIELFVGASGDASVELAIKAGGLCTTDPLPDLVETFTGAGGSKANTWTQIPLSWHESEDQAPERHVEGIKQFRDAGFEHVAVAFIGDDVQGFLRFWQDEVVPRL
jgi:hypothetical protein